MKSRAEYRVVLRAALFVAVAFAIWMGAKRFSRNATSGPLESATSSQRASTETPATLSDVDRDARRIVEPAEVPPSTTRSSTELRVRGRVLDALGAGAVGVGIHVRGDPKHEVGRSGANGAFELAIEEPPAHFVLDAEGDEWTSVRSAAVQTNAPIPADALLVVARAVEIAGVVVSDSGAEVGAAGVALPLYRELLSACPVPFDSTIAAEIRTQADAHGRFRLSRAPGIAGSFLVVTASGFRTEYVELDGRANEQLVVTLHADEREERTLEGIVLRSSGVPVEGAHVHVWDRSTSTDARGRFRLDRPAWLPDDAALVASHEGDQSLIRAGFGAFTKTASESELRSLLLVLGPAALAIDGRVVDTRGVALAGWVVSIVDGTEVADSHAPQLFAEQLATGRRNAVTDADGRFRVGGLFPRAYTLLAYDPKSLQSIRDGPFEAGRQDVVLTADVDAVARVAGRVVARSGTPVSHARVTLGFVTSQSPAGAKQWIQGASTTTDDDGHFAFDSVPRAGVHLDVSGDDVIPQSFELDRIADALSLSIALRCHFKVTLEGALPSSSWMEISDGAGAPLDIHAFEANVWTSSRKQPLDQPGSGVLAVSEDARTLRVLSGSDGSASVLAEVPLSLDPHAVNELRVQL